MATDYTRHWIQFFTGCGIPEDVATTYGLIFNENRIQKNMLLDLNKEYLRDMGITVMGDVIAILRHAKVVHDKYAREQVLSSPTPKSDNDGPGTKLSIKKSLEHSSRKCEPSGVPCERVQIQIENDKSLVNVPKKLAHRIGLQNKTRVRQKIEAPPMRNDDLVPGKLEVPVPKSRRVLPENEGGYRVKMPLGTTERSKKLLEKAKLKQSKTVFDRLGESSVSSTSDDPSASGITVNKLTCNREKMSSSVFSRLGEKSPLVTSSSNGDSSDRVNQSPYRGILKSNTAKKPVNNARGVSPNSTMRADNELHLAKTNSTKIKKINLKERLGTAVKGKQTTLTDAKKLNRIQIITTFEEEDEPPPKPRQILSKTFKSINAGNNESFKEKKNILDGVSGLRSEMMQNKPKVTSTTQLMEKRGVKRRLAEASPGQVYESLDGAQSKRVRFGQTTQRLIPGNAAGLKVAAKEYRNLAMRIGGNEITRTKGKLTLTSGMRIGPMNSDKMNQSLSVKDRIGTSVLPKIGRAAADLKRKRSLKLINRLKRGPISIHDRLG